MSERKLAVLLHADVVGSTALVQLDETLSHHRIQDTFRRFSETIARNNGIAHEIRGDALVAEFARVSDAVSASLTFQAANTVYNEQLSDDIRPVLRVGIAMGEVVVADNMVTGEGVVLAQRLEQLAQPGGIVIQGAAYETVPKRLPFNYENLGERDLKGFNEPVRIYTVNLKPGAAVPESESLSKHGASAPDVPDKPSIAVLPFTNMSGDPEQEYFSDGITEDIITGLSRFRDIDVIARYSSSVFKGNPVGIREAATKLGVRHIVEGSVRKVGNRVRITAQLIDSDGNHVWAERYDRELDDIFAVQDEVVRSVTATLVGRMEQARLEQGRRLLTPSSEAYDFYLQGRELFYKWTPESNRVAKELIDRAILLDPNYAAAHALLAEIHLRDWINFFVVDSASVELSRRNAERAVELDAADSRTHVALGLAHLLQSNHEQGRQNLDIALRLNPSDVRAIVYRGRYDMLVGDPDACITRIQEAKRYDPYGKFHPAMAFPLFTSRQYDSALSEFNNIRDPHAIVYAFRAATLAYLGKQAEAARAVENFLEKVQSQWEPDSADTRLNWVELIAQRFPYKKRRDLDHLIVGLRNAGIPE